MLYGNLVQQNILTLMEDNNSDSPGSYRNFASVLNMVGRVGGEISVIEMRVPVEMQMEYFKLSNKIREDNPDLDPESIDHCIKSLSDGDTSHEMKKCLISVLALSRNIKAYRFLEQFLTEQTDGTLQHWVSMALMECRISLEAELLDEKRIYISTGLGGRGNLLRYHVIMLAEGGVPFLPYQRDLIKREMPFELSSAGFEVERINVNDIYFDMMMLAPVSSNIRGVLSAAAAECNSYGDFISAKVTITNIRELSDEEIRRMIIRASLKEEDEAEDDNLEDDE